MNLNYLRMDFGRNQLTQAALGGLRSLDERLFSVKQFSLGVFRRVVSRLRRRSIERQILAAGDNVKSRQSEFLGLTDDMEKRFLTIGNDLEQVAASSETLVSSSEEFLKLGAGQIDDHDQFKHAAEVLRGPLEFLRDYQSCSAELARELHLRRDQIVQVCRLESEIESLLTPLRYIQVLFRIEASQLPTEIQNIFITLTSDIEQVHSKAIESVKIEFSKLENALEIVDKLVGKLNVQGEECRLALNKKHAAIERSLQELSASIAESQTRDIRLSRTIKAIRTEVSQVVTGIQFQDITRQKLQSVDRDLTKMEAHTAQFAHRRLHSSSTRPEALGRVNEIARVQMGQLAAIDSDLAGAQATMSSALSSILNKTIELDQDCITMQNLPSVANAEDGMVQVMLNATSEVRAMIASADIIETEIFETIYPLSGLASNLTTIVRKLSFDIKLIALNAQIQAAHLGSKSGLEVLSRKTCFISDGVNALNEQNGTQLHEMADALHKVVDNCRVLRERAQGQRKSLDLEGANVERLLHVFRDRVLEVFVCINDRSAQFRQKLEQTIALTQFHSLAAPRLEAAMESLEIIQGLTDPWKDSAPKMDEATLKEHLRRDYKMDSQRQVHLKAINKDSSLPGQDTAAVDWFESSDALAPKPESQLDLPEPGSKKRELPPPPPPAQQQGEGFGSNVEMF